jgi:outer membrane lipoprotein-sorting protein
MTGTLRRALRRLAPLALLVLFSAGAWAQTAEQIVRRLERNETHESSYAEGRMLIHDRFGDRTTSFRAWGRGEDESLIEFTSEGEAGQKILRTDDQIYLYYPDAAELIRLRGSALRDSVMGSDMSYEDLTSGGGFLSDYEVSLAGTEMVDGREAYRLEMEARSRDVPYASQTVWVDTERYVGLLIHMYSRSGDLIKVMTSLDFTEQAGKVFPVRMRIEDKLRRDTYTEFVFDEIQVDIPVDDSLFSLEELTF